MRWHLGHLPCGELRKDDQAHRDDPGDEHGVRQRKPRRSRDLHGALREPVSRFGKRKRTEIEWMH